MRQRNKNLQRLSSFSRFLLAEWRRLRLPIGDEVIVVAVSGGADSTALLLAVKELIAAAKVQPSICVAHLDHGIRKGSRADARWVARLARDLGFISVTGRAKVADLALKNSDNLEQSARRARYEFLERTAKRHKARFVLTAHTMDDQAETVLLQLMRGSSGDGLGGMEAMRPISVGSRVSLVRPLLWARREQTVNYCHQHRTDFLHDEMNEDKRFARVRIRKELLPAMKAFNNRIVEALSRTATLLRDDGDVLSRESSELLEEAITAARKDLETQSPAVSVRVLSGARPALRRRALRQWIAQGRGGTRRLEMVHLLAVERLLLANGGGTVELPGGAKVRRRRGLLQFDAENN